ncbi:ATPase [Synechococcales cyanobacterium C]|uniref:ATPase n=1 Tax=Petrachloros mirabilis ULC683 TaxID=2781853 RepID=A0A8K2A1Z9_9CYAN|nr:ABC-ATPase domain-containing protein [Petrachloros mirabilis]NCJ08371.1 ATPase [Petrachloros mirabilis ULC683]
MKTVQDLQQTLRHLEGRGYKAYRDLERQYQFPEFTLIFDRIQGDPFATPSQVRVQVPQSVAAFPPALSSSASRAVALRDYLTRQIAQAVSGRVRGAGSGNSGLIAIATPTQAILERTAVIITPEVIEARLQIGLPAWGRRIAGAVAVALLCEQLPQLVGQTLNYASLNPRAIQQHLETAEDADWLRGQLKKQNLVAFVADGAILPRRSGIDERPLAEAAQPFDSPPSLRMTFECPHQGRVTGMGIPAGVTVIVGGGYHGKSTLLHALQFGIYNHIPGDGRERVMTCATAVKIRAEEGRQISGVDLSPFINRLPQNRSTQDFTTANASGSTSQAANILEALEIGTELLLMDEDTAATNFMIRDRRMQALIAKDKEPISPFIDQVRRLYTDHGVSTILVMGGSGDYFDVADTVIALENFCPREVTAEARAIAQQYPCDRTPEADVSFDSQPKRWLPSPLLPLDGEAHRLKVRDRTLMLGKTPVDLCGLEQLIEPGQYRAIAIALSNLHHQHLPPNTPLAETLHQLIATIHTQGWDALCPFPQGDLAQIRPLELAAAIDRLRR